jgi:hypothetical protein
MAMSSTDHAYRSARCTNVAACPRAAADEAVEWYLGAGEYCPECGEALVVGHAPSSPPPSEPTSIASLAAAGNAKPSARGEVRLPLTAVDRLTVPPTAREASFIVQSRWF